MLGVSSSNLRAASPASSAAATSYPSAQEVLCQLGGVWVALGEQDQQPSLDRLGSAERHRTGGQPLGEQAMGIGRRDALVRLGLDKAELLDLVAGVHAVAARTAFWDRLPVAFFPGPQRRRRDAEHLGDGADAVHRPAAHRRTPVTPSPRRTPATSVKSLNLLRISAPYSVLALEFLRLSSRLP